MLALPSQVILKGILTVHSGNFSWWPCFIDDNFAIAMNSSETPSMCLLVPPILSDNDTFFTCYQYI